MSLKFLFQLVLVGCLLGCAPGQHAVMHTLRDAWGTPADTASLNPSFRYLRVTLEGRVALLVLGATEVHPAGPIEVWYSAEREVLRLQNGRLVGAVGMIEEWRDVRLPDLPDWRTLSQRTTPLEWVRLRDVMPGYRANVADTLRVARRPPARSSQLKNQDTQQLVWFEETALTLPPALYAVAPQLGHQVVYGEQCLSRQRCFTWQRWPPTP